MAVQPLTPDQQAKLDQFEQDASDASAARDLSSQADTILLSATASAAHAKQVALDAYTKAIGSSLAFRDAMIPPAT